jgi:hypothetical protein
LLLGANGCIESHGIRPLRPLELATSQYSETTSSALTGTLMYEDGCLFFRDDQSGAVIMPVWPDGSIFNGTSVIFHEPGKLEQPILLEQEMLISGRIVQWNDVPSTFYAAFRSQCGTEPFFVSKVRPAD